MQQDKTDLKIERFAVDEVQEPVYDEPPVLDVVYFFRLFLKRWKILVMLILISGGLMGYLRPGFSRTSWQTSITYYVPSRINVETDGKTRTVSNNVSQLSTAIQLMQTKIIRDLVDETTEEQNLGTYSVSQSERSSLVSVTVTGASQENTEILCEAVSKVFQEDVCKSLSINEMMEVDPMTSISKVTSSSTRSSVFRGMIVGFLLYTGIVILLFLTDRTLHSREEAENYLGTIVLGVFPAVDDEPEPSGLREKISFRIKKYKRQYHQVLYMMGINR